MCKEAETLLACVTCQPQQLLLIGDHQLLKPVVLNSTARSLGLDQSLFARYASQAYMLTTQYSMVRPSVCLSVSEMHCGVVEYTGRQMPILFHYYQIVHDVWAK